MAWEIELRSKTPPTDIDLGSKTPPTDIDLIIEKLKLLNPWNWEFEFNKRICGARARIPRKIDNGYSVLKFSYYEEKTIMYIHDPAKYIIILNDIQSTSIRNIIQDAHSRMVLPEIQKLLMEF